MKSMDRRRTGTLEPFVDSSGRTYYRGKIRLGDGSRERVDVQEPYCFDKKKSRAFVTEIQQQEDRCGGLLAKKQGKPLGDTSTLRQWSARWVLSRKARG